MEDLITIIIPTYKNIEYLSDCISSVLSQDYSNIELIVVDDGSDNFDVHFWKHYVDTNKKGNLRRYEVYSNCHNLGTVKSLNGALQKSHGEIIKIIAADDALYLSDTLRTVYAKINKSTANCFVCDVMLCDDSLVEKELADNTYIKQVSSFTPLEAFKKICIRNNINAVGIVFKKSFFDSYGYFDERFVLLEDWPTWLCLFSNEGKMEYLDVVIAKRRVTTGVVSNGNPRYLKDRRMAWKLIIKQNAKKIGFKCYIFSFITAYVFTIPFVRKLTYLFLKRR